MNNRASARHKMNGLEMGLIFQPYGE